MSLTTVILTKNAEKTLERCLKSVAFADEIIILDDSSTDKTKEIAHTYNANIIEHSLNDDFAQQRNKAMEQAKGDWLLFVDADEEVTPELVSEITSAISNTNQHQKVAYHIKRRDFWWGRELKHGEVSKVRQVGLIRLMKKDSGAWEGKVHERFVVNTGEIGTLQSFLNHYPHPTVSEFLQEVNMYSTLRARELYEQKVPSSMFHIILLPLGKFILTYFIKRGFLDGSAGFVYAFFMSFHSFLVRSKLYQYQKIHKN
jgi:glycosyltransferase involved in cell wall biosynthesis